MIGLNGGTVALPSPQHMFLFKFKLEELDGVYNEIQCPVYGEMLSFHKT